MSDFKVGDRVVVVELEFTDKVFTNIEINDVGTIMRVDTNSVDLKFDRNINKDGSIFNNWAFTKNQIKPIQEETKVMKNYERLNDKNLAMEITDAHNKFCNVLLCANCKYSGIDGSMPDCEIAFTLDYLQQDYQQKPVKPVLTETEKNILRNVDPQWKWVAREENCKHVCLYRNNPSINKRTDYDLSEDVYAIRLIVFSNLFKSIAFESGALLIEELVK